MALELEIKLQLPSVERLEEILSAPEILKIMDAPFREIPMETTYYDSQNYAYSRMHWTFRHRMEGEESVVCLKTPGALSHSRNEWQVIAPAPDEEAICALIRQGAPEELMNYYHEFPPIPSCGARFLRRCTMLTFSDGSRAEIAADRGEVFGAKGTLPILELELELYEGESTEMVRFATYLCQTYNLKEQPSSKFARARTLR